MPYRQRIAHIIDFKGYKEKNIDSLKNFPFDAYKIMTIGIVGRWSEKNGRHK